MTRRIILLQVAAFFLLGSGCCNYPHHPGGGIRRGGVTLALAQDVRMYINIADSELEDEESWSIPDGKQPPRILTLLTTYNKRTAFAKANRAAMEEREDGYESLMFVTSDEDDQEVDGAMDYTYGLAHNHRLLGAITEAYTRYKGLFDWMAIGDDDTVFLYNRAEALLARIDHTQEKNNTTAPHNLPADKGCCLDFTHPCNVPLFPSTSYTINGKREKSRLRPTWFKTEATRGKHDKEHKWTKEYGKGGLFWSYGGSGTFLSAGLLESVQGGGGGGSGSGGGGGGDNNSIDSSSSRSGKGGGWELCTEMFGIGYDTDLQLGMCLRAHGFSTSTYPEGFDRDCETADPGEIQERLADNCQVLGIHLGIRHLLNDEIYTAEAFKDAADAVHREDVKWASPTDQYMLENCPNALESIRAWELH